MRDEEEKSFYEATWGSLDSFMMSLSPDSDQGVIFPDGSIHGDTHVTCPIYYDIQLFNRRLYFENAGYLYVLICLY